jgi:hypothetical protein
LPAPFTFGDAKRNTVVAPGSSTVDLAIQKTLGMKYGSRVELRAEVFNLFNTVNFDLPNRIAFTPNFGRIFSAQPGRQMQVGIKFLF